MEKTATYILADFAANLCMRDLDPSTVKNAKLAILDAIACGVAGSTDPAVDVLVASLIQAGECGNTPIFARPMRFSPRAAALINGLMIHALELDDTHSFSSVHAGGPIVASALSACDTNGSDGKRFIEAIVVGYEIACRLGIAIRGKSPYQRGFHPTGICGIFGAATASGKIVGLDARGYLNAWGIVGSMAGGLMAYLQNGAWTKKLHPGWAAQAGFLASCLSGGGYLGPHDIFEGQYGFCSAYSDDFDVSALTQELGYRFEINRMSYKRFSCCRTIHAPITAALELRTKVSFQPEDIEEIHVVIADEDIDLVVEPLEKKKHPETPVAAQFSMPYGVALALVEGYAMPDQYTPEMIKKPLIRKLMEKFRYTISEEFTKRRPLYFPCELRVKIRDTWHTASVDAPVGDFTNPLPEGNLIEKFRLLCNPILGEEVRECLESSLLSLEEQDNAEAICSLFCGELEKSGRRPKMFHGDSF